MISKKARKQYLDRDFRNFDYVKDFEEPKINGYLKQIEPFPKFYTKPMMHQKVCFLIGAYFPKWAFFMATGTGKSKIALDLINHWNRAGKTSKTLILVPNVVNIDSWRDEASIHAPNLNVVGLEGSTAERKEEINKGENDVYIVNYQGLVYLATTPSKGKGRGKRNVDKGKVKWLCDSFDGLIMDESHMVKSWQTTTYQILNSMVDKFEVRYALTGTPLGRDPHDLWTQFRLIDRGETFGPNLSLFRSVFFNQNINYWGGYEYKFKKMMEKKLYEMIKNRSIRYSAEECLDLPDKVYRRISVTFPDGAKNYYDNVVEDIIGAQKGKKEKENAFIKMRQISSAFINVGEKGEEKVKVDFPDNPKLEALMTFIDGLPEDEKIVIFNEFIHSGDMVANALEKKKIKYSRLYSGTKDHSKQIQDFRNKKDCRVILINPQSGGTGINLQVARYAVFYESPVSPIVRHQAEARIYRKGQQANKVFIFDMVTKGTMDEKILYYIEQGFSLFDRLMEGKEEWK